MFKLHPNPTFSAKVPLSIPGQAKPAEIEVEFKFLTRKKVAEFYERLRTESKEDADALAEIIVGWKGIDEAYSPEALAMLLDNYPAASRDLFASFNRELMESRQKN